ncbi:MAG: tyrosine-type recombinase/integrase [Terrisporobacter sp.]|uniref:tyrosine-type recombinase/integrase n=1 Tax=Terrisporobacter sp. TaxID=1965305 RepID=UPI002FC7C66D
MEVLKEYMDYIKCKRKLSENTISSYYTDIKKYIEYLSDEKIKVEDVVEYDIINYLVTLEKQNISVATISRMTSSIKSFHDYLFLNHISNDNPANNIKKPKIKRGNVEILTEDEVEALLKFEDLSTPKKIRDKAIFETLYGTGIKVSELVELNISDIDLEIDYLYCNTGKNQRVIPLCEINKIYLEKYIKEGRVNIVKEGEDALFVNSQGQRFTRQGLWKIIKKYAGQANISKNINPSILRHSFAIHLLNGGANVAVVSRILGNSNLSSLQQYLNQIDENIRKEMNEKHPRKR